MTPYTLFSAIIDRLDEVQYQLLCHFADFHPDVTRQHINDCITKLTKDHIHATHKEEKPEVPN